MLRHSAKTSLDTKAFQWSLYDFELMVCIAENDKIPIKSAMVFLELQSKIFFNLPVFSRLTLKPLLMLAAKNKGLQQIQDFLYKFSRTSLGLFFSLHRKPSNKEKKKQKMTNSKKALPEFSEQEQKLLKSNKKAMVIELLRSLLALAEPVLKARIKTLICQMIYQMKKNISKKPNKNLMGLIEGLGEDPEKAMVDYETDYFKKLSTMKEEEKKIMEERQQKSIDMDNISRISGESSKDLNALTLSLDLISLKSKSSFRRNSFIDHSPKGVLSKADELKMNMLRNANIDPRLRRKLEAIKETRKEKLKVVDETMKDAESKLIVRKIKLRKQVELKSMGHGVLAPNIKDKEAMLLYPLDSLDQRKETHGVELVDFALLEDFERNQVEECFDRMNIKILKKAFHIYSNARERVMNKPDTFEKIAEAKKLMSANDLWTLLKDLENKEIEETDKNYWMNIENDNLVKMVKAFLTRDAVIDEPRLEFHQFKQIVISIARIVFIEEELAGAVRKFIGKLGILVKFNNSEKLSEQETAELQEINDKLSVNPDSLMPEGFIKVKQKKTLMEKQWPESFLEGKIREGYLISYEVLDELLGKLFQIELIEKLPKVEERVFARHTEKKKTRPDSMSKSMNVNTELNLSSTENKKPESEEIASQKPKKRKLKPQILQKKEENKEDEAEKARKLEEEAKIKEQQKKEEREKAKKRLEELQQSRLRYEQEMRAYWDKKRQRNYGSVGVPPMIEKKLAAAGRKNKQLSADEKAKKKKEFDEFNKKKLEIFKEQFQKMVSEKKKELEAYTTMSNAFNEKLLKYNEKILPKTLEETRNKVEEKRENELVVEQNFKKPEIQHFFTEYEATIKALFNFLIKQTYTPLNFNMERKTIPLETLEGFANEFNVCPVLFKLKHIVGFFKNITKKKPYSIDRVQVGLEYEEFLECLFRIAVKGNEFLNKMCEYLIMGGFLQPIPENNEEGKEHNEEKKEGGQEKPKKIKNKKTLKKEIMEKNKSILTEKYINVTLTTENTLVALIYYLGFPIDAKDRDGVQQRFRDIISFRKIKPTKYRFLGYLIFIFLFS